MKNSFFIYLILFLVILMSSCKEKTESVVDKNVVAEVDGEYLYEKDIVKLLPKYLNSEDSTAFVDDYIDNWIAERVFYLEAKKTLQDTSIIAQKIKDYRKQLYIYYYKENVIYSDLSYQIKEQELKDYYDAHLQDYILSETYVKAYYMTISAKRYTYYDEREKINNSGIEDKKQLQDYCIGTDRKVYFLEEWTELSSFLDMINYFDPFDANELLFKSFFDHVGGDLRYLVKIEEFIPMGDYIPFEIAKKDIVEIIINNRKRDKYIQAKKDLIDNGIKSGIVVINN